MIEQAELPLRDRRLRQRPFQSELPIGDHKSRRSTRIMNRLTGGKLRNFEVEIKDRPATRSIASCHDAGDGKALYLRRIRDAYPGVKFTDIRIRLSGSTVERERGIHPPEDQTKEQHDHTQMPLPLR